MGKVLIIDDEKQILSLLSRIIGLEGYEVFQAANCKVGIKQLEQNDPEVVLCDVCLPDGSGVELVSELKRLRPLSEVILLTAHGNIPTEYKLSRTVRLTISPKVTTTIKSFP